MYREESGYSSNPEHSTVDAPDDHRRSHKGVEVLCQNAQDKDSQTRYFIIKSLNHQNIKLSVEKGIWATQVMNEPILEEAFHNSSKVILIFSVNMSGFFQGYAQMMSSVGWRRDNVWSQGCAGGKPWGRTFKVKWLQLCDLSFQKTFHLKNPLNEFRPVKISRDCQELSQGIGEALCELLDEQSDVNAGFGRDDFQVKKPCMKPSGSDQVDEYNLRSVHTPQTSRSTRYPAMVQQLGIGASQFQFTEHRSNGHRADDCSINNVAPRVTHLKTCHDTRNFTKKYVEQEGTSQLSPWSMSALGSPFSCSLTEDEFLQMSYEEYLEVHSRNHTQIYILGSPVTGSSEEFPTHKEHDDVVFARCSRKRSHS